MSEILGWLLFRSRSAGVLLRMLVACLESLRLAGIARYIGMQTMFVCDAEPQLPTLRQDKDE